MSATAPLRSARADDSRNMESSSSRDLRYVKRRMCLLQEVVCRLCPCLISYAIFARTTSCMRLRRRASPSGQE